ncbi:MAG: site-specific integrase [Aliarcobacter sp.]|nr:site-specific integrase [Aliarcobacter sp.]
MIYIENLNEKNLITFTKKDIPIKELKEFNYNLLTGIKSEKTLQDYYIYLMDFLKTIYDLNNIQPNNNEIVKMLYNSNQEDISNYIMLLKNERNLKHSSINKIISALKHFFKEIEMRDISFINPIKNIKYFKKDPVDPEKILRLSKSDIKKMIDNVKIENEKDFRNSMIMKTLYYTGMRSDELRSLKYKQILEKDGKFIIKLDKTKSQKIQYIPLFKKLALEILEYKKKIQYNFQISNEKINDYFVFPAFFEKNNKLTGNSLNYMLKKYAETILNKNISAHFFRHAIATEMLLSENNISISDVQDFLRHSDIKTTKIYDDAIELKKQSTVEKIPEL